VFDAEELIGHASLKSLPPLAFAGFACISRLIKHPVIWLVALRKAGFEEKPSGTRGFRLPVSPLSTVPNKRFSCTAACRN
jgi:hypothetical protein